MTCLRSTPTASDNAASADSVQALLALLRTLTSQALPAPPHAAIRPDAADIEYESWMSGPGALEFDSWAPYLRHSVR
jgi:hypothetical protein